MEMTTGKILGIAGWVLLGAGDKSAMHSHPEAVVVVLKGGRVRNTFPDGTQKVIELKTGEPLSRSSAEPSGGAWR